MLISETKSLLTSMLDLAGVRPGEIPADAVRTTVEVFQRFASVPVDDSVSPEEDGDGVLAQSGTFDLDGVHQFCADLTRQFIDSADRDVIWQLRCTFQWIPSAETEALGSSVLWSFGMPLEDFFAAALGLPGWAWALAGVRAPRRLTIELEQV
ncbi:hypothetical protein CO540_07450 [Micromonospora sp. WMMA2032]|uniref:hypothetical protein n=1 Tax=unclassified Micromonospora TaxID=2617518 RepID=UPI000C058C67|nr:hypothetical protein [Micromonospora sp. WMMA2032]ATO13681.1 hypothetical protein CO540_07450 [Micromonospora sp. WMMA2032]